MSLDLGHRLWRSLPHRLRRSLFDAVSFNLAPRLHGEAALLQPPFIVAGALRAPTGLGEAARLAIRALREAGVDARAFDLTDALKQSAVLSAPAVPAAAPGPGAVLLFVNPPACAYSLSVIGRSLLNTKQRVGCWVWEYETAPANWRNHARLFHHIAAPSQFAARAIERAIGRPVALLPHPVAAVEPPQRRMIAGRFTIGLIGDMAAAAGRKNPFAVVDAAARAMSGLGGARLRLYLRGAEAFPSETNDAIRRAATAGLDLSIVSESVNDADHRARMSELDVFVSLHRAEGFGLTIAEAMHCGVPVVATDWSATRELLDEETGYPIPYELADAPPMVETPRPGRWANPDLDAAALAIRRMRDVPAEASKKAAAAQRRIRDLLSAKTFYRRLAEVGMPKTASDLTIQASAPPSFPDPRSAARSIA